MGKQTDESEEKPVKWADKSLMDKIKEISTITGGVIAAIGGMMVIISGATTFIKSSRQPIIAINNHLALPVIVVVNESANYTERVEAGSSETITILSDDDFPVRVAWSVIRNRNGAGEEMGEQLAITSDNPIRVDKEGTVNITNKIGGNTYFYPKIYNNTDDSCIIVINDGLVIQYTIGASKPNSRTGVTGYFKYADNSNVTLHCQDVPTMWHGKRNGKMSPVRLQLVVMSGITEINFP